LSYSYARNFQKCLKVHNLAEETEEEEVSDKDVIMVVEAEEMVEDLEEEETAAAVAADSVLTEMEVDKKATGLVGKETDDPKAI